MALMQNEHGEWAQKKYPHTDGNAVIEYEVGQSFCYPHDRIGFSSLIRIPEAAARAWLQDLGIRLNPDYDATDNANNCNQWLNKLAVVVDVRFHPEWRTLCLYNHDGTYGLVVERWRDEL